MCFFFTDFPRGRWISDSNWNTQASEQPDEKKSEGLTEENVVAGIPADGSLLGWDRRKRATVD